MITPKVGQERPRKKVVTAILESISAVENRILVQTQLFLNNVTTS